MTIRWERKRSGRNRRYLEIDGGEVQEVSMAGLIVNRRFGHGLSNLMTATYIPHGRKAAVHAPVNLDPFFSHRWCSQMTEIQGGEKRRAQSVR